MRYVGLWCCACLAISGQAVADRATADTAAAEAETLVKRGEFLAAAAKFREAFGADARPELMCNVGIAYYKAKDLPRADRYLEQCLVTGKSLDPAFLDQVTKVGRAIVDKLKAGDFTPVDLIVQPASAGTTIEGGVPFDEPIIGPRRAWFPFGKYKLTVHAEGYVDRTLDLDANTRAAIVLRVPLERAQAVIAPDAKPPDAKPPDPEPPEVSQGSAAPMPATVPHEPPRAPRTIAPALVATSVTVSAGITALALFVLAKARATDAGNADLPDEYFDLRDDAIRFKHASWIVGGVAGVGALATGYLWYRVTRSPARVEVSASGSGGGVALSGRW